jgi:carbon-monoxide dehydrogenase small subunit
VSVQLSLTVNGKAVSTAVDARTLLVELLRNQLGLTGTHVGCDTGQCGACTVLLDGRAVKACNMLRVNAANVQSSKAGGRRWHAATDVGGGRTHALVRFCTPAGC